MNNIITTVFTSTLFVFSTMTYAETSYDASGCKKIGNKGELYIDENGITNNSTSETLKISCPLNRGTANHDATVGIWYKSSSKIACVVQNKRYNYYVNRPGTNETFTRYFSYSNEIYFRGEINYSNITANLMNEKISLICRLLPKKVLNNKIYQSTIGMYYSY